jgi:hypothetical protein
MLARSNISKRVGSFEGALKGIIIRVKAFLNAPRDKRSSVGRAYLGRQAGLGGGGVVNLAKALQVV